MKNKFTRLFLVLILSVSLGAYFYTGCGGGADSGRSINLGGVVMAPTVSGNIAVPPQKGISKAVSDTTASGVTCIIYTIEGENLGSITTASDGTFTLSADLATLKGSEDTSTTWTEPVILDCGNGIQLYADVTVNEDSLADISIGTATFNTTLSANTLASNISGWNGWGTSYKDNLSTMDMKCIFDAMSALWTNSSITGSGLADDNGYIRDTVMGYMAAGKTAEAVGYDSWINLIQAILKGELAADKWAQMATDAASYIGADAATLAGVYGTSYGAFSAINTVIAAQFSTGGYGIATIKTGSGTICEDLKAGNFDGNAFIKPILAATDVTSFGTTYGDAEGIVAHFGLLKQCQDDSSCDNLSNKPGAFFGFLEGYGGTFTDLWTGSVLNNTSLEGVLLAAASCSGSTIAEMAKCAESMNKIIYTGASGEWTKFMTDSAFDSGKFGFWGEYYTGLATAEDFEPSGLDYANLWSSWESEMNDTTTRSAIEECVEAIYAAGGYDTSSCFTGTAYPTTITSGYYYAGVVSAEACNFSDVTVDTIYIDGAYNIIYIYYETPSSDISKTISLPYVSCVFQYDSSTGVASYTDGTNSVKGKFTIDSAGNDNFIITSGSISTLGTCTTGGTGKVYTYSAE